MHNYKKNCVSIIVAIYNMEIYLERCIRSILKQTYGNLEILLINDGSTDNSKLIAEEYQKKDKRIYLYNLENGGVANARNTGLKYANGEYVAFIDPDDWVEPDFIEKLIQLNKKNNSEISCVGYNIAYDDGVESPKIRTKTCKLSNENCMLELCKNKWFMSYLWNKLYRRELFENIIFPNGRNYEDISIMHELINRAKTISCSEEELYHYYVRKDSIVHVMSAKNEIDIFYAYKSRWDAVKENKKCKKEVLKCCSWACYQVLYVSEHSFSEQDYAEVMCFWTNNRNIKYLGIKYFLFYCFPKVYKIVYKIITERQ